MMLRKYDTQHKKYRKEQNIKQFQSKGIVKISCITELIKINSGMVTKLLFDPFKKQSRNKKT